MGWLDKLRGKRECKKLINYDTRTLEFGTDVGSGIFSLNDFKSERQPVHMASEFAKAIDDYQYMNCEEYKHLTESEQQFKDYLEERSQVLKLLTALRVTLLAYKSDPEGQKENLNSMVKDIHVFLGGTKREPSDPGFFYKKATALKELGKADEAVNSFDKAIKLDSESAGFYYQKAITLIKLERFQEALDSFERAIKIDPRDPGFWYNKGEVLLELGQYEDAVKSFDEAILLNSKMAGFWYKRAVALKKLEQFEKAITSYDEAIKISSDDPGLWYDRACLQIQQDKIEESLSDLKKAIELGGDKFKEQVKHDKHFDQIKNNQKFKEFVL